MSECKVHFARHYQSATLAGLQKKAGILGKATQATAQALTPKVPLQTTVYHKLAQFLSAPKCDNCGKTFPSIETWDESMALVLDSIPGISKLVSNAWCPDAIHWSMADYQTIQLGELAFIELCVQQRCHFVAITLLALEVNEISGVPVIYPMATGAKNGAKLGPLFDEVVLCKQGGTNTGYTWSTMDNRVVVKHRILPRAAGMPADFSAITKRLKETPIGRGVNVLLTGDPGSGKTHSVLSFLGTGVTPFIIFTEPGESTIMLNS